jgi:YVTN family beta-propeller protein
VRTSDSLLAFDRDLGERSEVQLPAGAEPAGLAFAEGSLFVAGEGSGDAYRVEPGADEPAHTFRAGASQPFGVAVGEGAVWLVDRAGDAVYRTSLEGGDPESFEVGDNPKGVAVAGGRVYVANADGASVSVLDASSGEELSTIQVGGQPRGVAALDGVVWVSNGDDAGLDAGEKDGWLTAISADNSEVLARRVSVGGSPEGVAAGGGEIWTATGSGREARAVIP